MIWNIYLSGEIHSDWREQYVMNGTLPWRLTEPHFMPIKESCQHNHVIFCNRSR